MVRVQIESASRAARAGSEPSRSGPTVGTISAKAPGVPASTMIRIVTSPMTAARMPAPTSDTPSISAAIDAMATAR